MKSVDMLPISINYRCIGFVFIYPLYSHVNGKYFMYKEGFITEILKSDINFDNIK